MPNGDFQLHIMDKKPTLLQLKQHVNKKPKYVNNFEKSVGSFFFCYYLVTDKVLSNYR